MYILVMLWCHAMPPSNLPVSFRAPCLKFRFLFNNIILIFKLASQIITSLSLYSHDNCASEKSLLSPSIFNPPPTPLKLVVRIYVWKRRANKALLWSQMWIYGKTDIMSVYKHKHLISWYHLWFFIWFLYFRQDM